MEKTFMTIREVARTGIISEHHLRIMFKSGKLPHIMCGSKCMVNYPLLVKKLTEESERSVICNA